MRSSAGARDDATEVPGAPKTSSVMIRTARWAPYRRHDRGGHQAVHSEALCLITPPNFGFGRRTRLPLMVVVALAEPGTPMIRAPHANSMETETSNTTQGQRK